MPFFAQIARFFFGRGGEGRSARFIRGFREMRVAERGVFVVKTWWNVW